MEYRKVRHGKAVVLRRGSVDFGALRFGAAVKAR